MLFMLYLVLGYLEEKHYQFVRENSLCKCYPPWAHQALG